MRRATLIAVVLCSCTRDEQPDGGHPIDAGRDAGSHAETDAGPPDAGVGDAGFDGGGFDAGFGDAGVDAGSDAGHDAGSDAGSDAGVDAGPVTYLGTACQSDGDCTLKLGAGARCKQHPSNDPLGTYPGGYCTIPCSSTQGCPDGGICAIADGGALLDMFSIFGEGEAYCAPACELFASDGCRDEYSCLQPYGDPTPPFCWWDFSDPEPGELRHARGEHAQKVGLSCTQDSDCVSLDAGLRQLETCLTGYPGGYCTADATLDYTNDFCGPAAWSLLVVGSGYQCLAKCSPALGGQGSCRPGYVCHYYSEHSDGGLTDGYCAPACVSSSECSLAADGGHLACLPSGYCEER